MMQKYEQLIERISKASGLSFDEINRKVEAKCAKLSGLISKEGSAQIVASELGVNFEKEKMKISELSSGMKKINVVGKIISEPRINFFTTKNGIEGKVASMTLADDTSNIRLVLWDTNQIALFENGKLKMNDIIEIINASVRNDELHLGNFSIINPGKENFERVVMKKQIPERKISELKSGNSVKLRAFITQIFEPKFFEVCPKCGKKPINNECITHGNIVPEKRALISVILDDGTGNIRAVIFNDEIEKIGISKEEIENPETFIKKKQEILGSEMYFSAIVKNNSILNTTEIIIKDIEKIEIDSLIEKLRD
ncbi:MAG: hypothetical protein QXH60_01235 [Candidatus Pacearchaeota archaeon]